MAKSGLIIEIAMDETIEVLRDFGAAMQAVGGPAGLPGHVRVRAMRLARKPDLALAMSRNGSRLTAAPSGELLAVLALVRGCARRGR